MPAIQSSSNCSATVLFAGASVTTIPTSRLFSSALVESLAADEGHAVCHDELGVLLVSVQVARGDAGRAQLRRRGRVGRGLRERAPRRPGSVTFEHSRNSCCFAWTARPARDRRMDMRPGRSSDGCCFPKVRSAGGAGVAHATPSKAVGRTSRGSALVHLGLHPSTTTFPIVRPPSTSACASRSAAAEIGPSTVLAVGLMVPSSTSSAMRARISP